MAVAGVVAVFLYQHQMSVRLREEKQSLQDQVQRLTAAAERPPKPAVPASESRPVSDEPLRELLKLRGEITVLRREQDELLKRLVAKATPTPVQQSEAERAWVQQILSSTPKG